MVLQAVSLFGRRTPITILSRDSSPILDKGDVGDAFISRVAIGRHRLTLFEKRYPLNVDEHCEPRPLRFSTEALAGHSMRAYSLLKKAGIKVPPTYRWVRHEDGRHSLLQTDLSFGGKRTVVSVKNVDRDEVPKVSNLGEIIAQAKREIRLAANNNARMQTDEWMLSIDPKTGHALMFASDFDYTALGCSHSNCAGRLQMVDEWAANLRQAYKAR